MFCRVAACSIAAFFLVSPALSSGETDAFADVSAAAASILTGTERDRGADLALPKRQATPAQLAAIAKALRARRTCPICGTEKPYYIPRSLGECPDCTGR